MMFLYRYTEVSATPAPIVTRTSLPVHAPCLAIAATCRSRGVAVVSPGTAVHPPVDPGSRPEKCGTPDSLREAVRVAETATDDAARPGFSQRAAERAEAELA